MSIIFLISPERWGINHVSKHHYALALAESGQQVYFINPPTRRFETRLERERLTIVDYKPLFKGLRFLPFWLQAYFTRIEIERLEKQLGARADKIWNFDSSRFFNLSMLGSRYRICHIVDMAENIQRHVLARTSDICFCTTDFLQAELARYNAKVYKIHHGVYLPKTYSPMPVPNPVTAKPQVGYVGNLSRNSIDWDTWNEIISAYPEVTFTFIGSVDRSNLSDNAMEGPQLAMLSSFANVRLLGSVPSQELPQYLAGMDILTCFYKMDGPDDLRQHANLHKTMEYLASGRVIVCSYSDEYKDKRELLEMVDENKDLPGRFRSVLENMSEHNSEEKFKQRISFAFEHTYARQIEKINRLIDQA